MKTILLLFILSIFNSLYSQEDCKSSRIKYLEQNIDVKKAGLDPWKHFQNKGKKEGRIWPPCDEKNTITKEEIIEFSKNDSIKIIQAKINLLNSRLDSIKYSLKKYTYFDGREVTLDESTIKSFIELNKTNIYCISRSYYNNNIKNYKFKFGGEYTKFEYFGFNSIDDMYFGFDEINEVFITLSVIDGNRVVIKDDHWLSNERIIDSYKGQSESEIQIGEYSFKQYVKKRKEFFLKAKKQIDSNSNFKLLDESSKKQWLKKVTKLDEEYLTLRNESIYLSNELKKQTIIEKDYFTYLKNIKEENNLRKIAELEIERKKEATKYPGLVKIGYNFWQNQNCRITKYMNGDPIRFVSNSKELDEANKRQEGAYCFVNFEYKNESDSNYIIYNWYAIMDPRGFGTKDLKIPNWKDWKNLISTFEKDGKTENDLKKEEVWPINKKYNTSNYYGFNGVPTFCGTWDLYYQREVFSKELGMCYWIPDDDVGSYTSLEKGKAYQAYFVNDGYKLYYNQQNKNAMFPVRLIKGETSFFDGDIVSGKKEGNGKFYVRSDDPQRYDYVNFINVQAGSIIEGNWINNKIEGKAYITWSDGTRVEALFKDNYHQGEFTLRNNSTQKCIYDGKTFNSHYKKSENEIENEKTTTKSISINSYKIELYCSSSCEAKAKAEIMARERQREIQSQSQSQSSNNNSTSTSVKSDMHVYVCNDCGKIQTSKSSPYDKSTCPETRWGGIGGSTNGKANGDHEYQDMGNSGSQQYVCSGCKTSIMLFQKPTNSGACGAGGTNTFNHQWQKH